MNEELPWFLGEAGLEALRVSDNYVVLDFETTNKTNGFAVDPRNSLVLACWTVVDGGVHNDRAIFGDEYDMQPLLRDCKNADFIVAHNAQFELAWLARCGLDLHDVLCYDTMVMEWVIHGNQTVPYNLEATAKRHGFSGKESLVSTMIKLGVCPSLIPRSWLLKYCEKDVELCHDIFLKQREIISKKDLWHIALARNLTIPVLADIQVQGLELDKDKVYAEEVRLTKIVEELGDELDEITGGINLGSTKQLATFLYETLGFDELVDHEGNKLTTKGGARATSKDVIAKLNATNETQTKFLSLYKEYNAADSLLSKNISFFKKVCDHLSGKFYGTINQCRTATHRLASSGIAVLFPGDKTESKNQIQNLPRQYKSLFTSHDPDYVVMEHDGAQIEFRVAADLGKDKQAESDIVNGVDIHSFTRDTMNAAYRKYHIDKQIDRQEAKARTFAPLFGALGNDDAEKEYTKAFRAKYPGIAQTQQDWTLQVADRKQLATPYGMIYYWPDAKLYRSGYVSYTTEIYNIPVNVSGF